MIFDEIWRLRKRRDRVQREYDRLIQQAEKKKDYEQRECLGAEAMQDRQLFNDQIYSAETWHLRRQAERLGLPVPDYSDKSHWQDGYAPGTVYLSATARTALRQAIRRERHERLEFAIAVVKDLAVPVTGVIATLVSLVLASKLKH